MKRVHAWISGRVQGVCFRYYTREQAGRLGCVGWVRNLADGRVELVAEGDDCSVDALIEWCGHGPSMAHVEEIVVKEEPVTGEYHRFAVTG